MAANKIGFRIHLSSPRPEAAVLAAGRIVPDWVDAALAAKGCEILP